MNLIVMLSLQVFVILNNVRWQLDSCFVILNNVRWQLDSCFVILNNVRWQLDSCFVILNNVRWQLDSCFVFFFVEDEKMSLRMFDTIFCLEWRNSTAITLFSIYNVDY